MCAFVISNKGEKEMRSEIRNASVRVNTLGWKLFDSIADGKILDTMRKEDPEHLQKNAPWLCAEWEAL